MSGPRGCPSCAAPVASATARFCAECGVPLTEERRQRDEVEEIVGHRETTGARKFVTILFADIQGSTSIADGLDPEEWYRALESFHGVATAAVHEFDGVVTLYAGDGVMALFGAPIADENHALAACHAALRLVSDFDAMADRLEPVIGARLGIRVGLNSGGVVVGKIGQGVRVDYTAQGMPVHIAARMEQIADSGEVFVAPATAVLVRDEVELDDAGLHVVKGAQEAIHVHRLVGISETVDRAGGAFVGRRAELETLRATFDDVAGGRRRVVAVLGPAGHGKTRLVTEFLRELARTGATTMRVKAEAVRVPRPGWIVARIIQRLVGLDGTEDEDAVSSKLRSVDPALARHAPTFDAVLTPGRSYGLDPDVFQRRLDAALASLVSTVASATAEPLVIAVDDIHALDKTSAGALISLADGRHEGRTLLIFTARPDPGIDPFTRASDPVIDLRALDRTATGELVARHLSPSASDDERDRLTRVLHDRTDGNPFFLEEMLRSLREQGVLSGGAGEARLIGDLTDLTLPPTVQTVVAARIDRLRPEDRSLLHVASVLGVEFDDDVLARVAGVVGTALGARLRRLTAATLVAPTRRGHRFHHRTIQEVAYETQLRDRRETLHATAARAIAEWSAAAGAGEAAYAAEIGDHHERAGEHDDAATWYQTAATAAASHDPAESKRLWERVRDLTEPDSDARVARALAARAEILGQGVRVGASPDAVHEILAESREIARAEGQEMMLAVVLLRGWYALNGVGLTTEARAISQEAVELADRSGVPLLSIGTRLAEVSNYSASRPPAEGLVRCDEVEALLADNDPGPDSMMSGQLDFCRGSLLVRQGHVDESLSLLESSVEIADRAGDTLWRVVTRTGLVVAMAAARAPAGLRKVAAEARRIADDVGGASEVTMATRAQGLAALAEGAAEEAAALLQEALDESRRAGALSTEEMMLCALSEADRQAGRPTRARERAAEAIDLSTRRENENYELMGHLAFAAAALDIDPGDAAIATSLARAAELIAENGIHLYDDELAELTRRREEHS